MDTPTSQLLCLCLGEHQEKARTSTVKTSSKKWLHKQGQNSDNTNKFLWGLITKQRNHAPFRT